VYLQNSFNKYGEDAFVFLLVHECTERTRVFIEWLYIRELNPDYNIVRHMRGLSPMTEERKIRIRETTSKSCKEVWENRSKEDRTKIRNNQSIAQRLRWRQMDDEQRRHLSQVASENMKRIWAERRKTK